MSPHLDDLALLDMSLGTCPSAHLEGCARCQGEVRRTRETLHLLPLALPFARPSATLRVRLLAAVAGPLTDHAPALAAMFDLPEATLHTLLTEVAAGTSGTSTWRPFLPNVERHPLRSRSGESGGLLRVAPGCVFPRHRHQSDERLRILQGSCTDSSGAVLGPGDELHHSAGSTHDLVSHAGPPLVLAYLGRAELVDAPA